MVRSLLLLYLIKLQSAVTDMHTFKGTDIVFGGPPCQGFSIAGKMNPDDPRSQLLWVFMEVVKLTKPRAFVFENVKALATFESGLKFVNAFSASVAIWDMYTA